MKIVSQPPSFAKSRRGNSVSVLDAIVQSLWRTSPRTQWPQLTFSEITQRTSVIVGYEVKAPAIRGYMYKRPELFERQLGSTRTQWSLSEVVRTAHGSS